ncbi:hypothetical protein B0H14DRAFT_2616247 [Mycena olivaceomarginata]|nr:hypothetical protein B0H14DRAFT_2616247 [Mycena olivaceomarginata]
MGFRVCSPVPPQSPEILQGLKPVSFVWMPNDPRLGAESSEALHAYLALGILLVAFAFQCTVGGRVAVTFSRSMCPMNTSRVLLTIVLRVKAEAPDSSMRHSHRCICPMLTHVIDADFLVVGKATQKLPLYPGPHQLCRLHFHVSQAYFAMGGGLGRLGVFDAARKAPGKSESERYGMRTRSNPYARATTGLKRRTRPEATQA